MAKRPASSQDCHFECTYDKLSKEELSAFITHVRIICGNNSTFNVTVQGGFDEVIKNKGLITIEKKKIHHFHPFLVLLSLQNKE